MLDQLFQPRSIALIGASATPGKLGFDILENLLEKEYLGKVFPVNPKVDQILGHKAYASVPDIPDEVDLAIIAVPAAIVIQVLGECIEKGIHNVVIISAGFQEIGGEGVQREEQLRQMIATNNINLVGPNCLGILNPHAGLNASFAETLPNVGNIALVSQSGAMAVAIMDWASGENIGFSKIISLGNKAGVNENTCLEYLAADPTTEVIAMYLESFVAGRAFMDIAKKVAQKKPIILLKSGISEAGSQAVSSHTGALAGSDQAVQAALAQSGVIRADTIEDFFDYTQVLSMQPLPADGNVAIITNAGGPGVIATDVVARSQFLKMAEFSSQTTAQLQKTLPATANIHNPVDVIGDALADRYESALAAVLPDEAVDAVLVMLTPQVMTEKERTVRVITRLNEQFPRKTIITAFMGGKNITYAAEKLAEHDIPNFLSPDRALGCLEKMVWLQQWRSGVAAPADSHGGRQESPKSPRLLAGEKVERKQSKTKYSDLQKEVRREKESGEQQVSPALARKLLASFDITVPDVRLATTADEAVQYAEKLGYPVVLKISSDDILHKTDVGGIRLALKNEEEVRTGFADIMNSVQQKMPDAAIEGILIQKMYHFGREVIIGMKRDPVFGPLIMFGLGGVYVEVMKDVAFRVAPFDLNEAKKMIHEVKAIQLLKGVRGEAPADIDQLAQTLLHIAELGLTIPEIQEMDINPLLVMSAGKGVMAVDVRMIL